MSNLTEFAGQYNAIEFAFGSLGGPPALWLTDGNEATGAGLQVRVNFGQITLRDGTPIFPFATTCPLSIGGEAVTPSAVTGNPLEYGGLILTGTFASAHGSSSQVKSATFGLQEALNYAALQGGGAVIIDAAWVAAGGTTGIKNAATVPSGVTIQDNRSGGGTGAVDSVFGRTGDVVAANGDYDISEIANAGTAAGANLGTDPAEVPTNADLPTFGSAAEADLGTDPGEVPTNADLGSAAYQDVPDGVPIWVAVPASAAATGVSGQLARESGFLYVCVATDTWERVAIATWP